MPKYSNKNQIGTTKNYVESRISGSVSGYAFNITDGSSPATINSGNTVTFAGAGGVTVSQSAKTVTITGSSGANYYVTGATLGGAPNYTLSLARNGGLSDVTVNLSSLIDDTNSFVTGSTFNTGTGVLALQRNDSLADVTVDLDGRYAYASDIAGATDRVAFFSDADSVTGSADFTWDDTDLSIVSSTSEKPRITLENTNADANPPFLRFFKNTASPADADQLGAINFTGKEETSGDTKTYWQILGRSNDVTNTTPNGQLDFYGLDGDSPGFIKQFGFINSQFSVWDSNGQGLVLSNTGTNGGLVKSIGNKLRIQAKTDSTGEVHIMAQGGVGIGTTSPDIFGDATMLTTTGDISVQGGSIYFGTTDKVKWNRGGGTYFQA